MEIFIWRSFDQYVLRLYKAGPFEADKVIREKSCGEGSLIGQDTIENVSEPNFFFKLF